MQLIEADIRTKEVLDWKGVHLLHGAVSTCSQKLRIALNIKRIPWESHLIDLQFKANLSDFYLGINPRGLVPVLVHDGAVHIESNDLLVYLEENFPGIPLIPEGRAEEMETLLRIEDDLHLDLRALSFRFLFVPQEPKTAADLERYATRGSGTVQGRPDENLAHEISFWRNYVENGGITDAEARLAAGNFREAFDAIEQRLDGGSFLMGDEFSLLDIAWIVYANRLVLAGYPLERLHPRLAAWFRIQAMRPEIVKEITLPPPLAAAIEARRRKTNERSLDDVCFS